MTKQKSKMGYLLEFDCALRVSEIEYRASNIVHRAKTAVTLVEIIIVVAVVALLAAMVVVAARSIDNQAREKGAEGLFTVLGGALEEYYEFEGYFPEQTEKDFAKAAAHSEYLYVKLRSIPDSRKLLEKINDSSIKNDYGPTDSPPEIYDPWGTALDYQYDADGDSFPKLISAGPDRVPGNADDITNR